MMATFSDVYCFHYTATLKYSEIFRNDLSTPSSSYVRRYARQSNDEIHNVAVPLEF
jgi:hypothetical protein